jgi:hypothetical protein
VQQYFLDQLGLDVSVAWDAYDWVSLSEQRLCAMTAGAVFHDELDLEKVRLRARLLSQRRLAVLVACRLVAGAPGDESCGRAGYAGDELGSALIASEIVSGLSTCRF